LPSADPKVLGAQYLQQVPACSIRAFCPFAQPAQHHPIRSQTPRPFSRLPGCPTSSPTYGIHTCYC
jgi:hypothetical protein